MLVVKLTSELVEHQRMLTTRFAAADSGDTEVGVAVGIAPAVLRTQIRAPSI